MSKIIKSISDIISLYDVFILDQWGVMHDGYKGYDFAIDSVEKLISANKKLIIISNSTLKRSNTLSSLYKHEVGGLSGKPLFIDSTIILKKMYSLTNGQIPLIGVGGITNGNECYEKIKAGASLVQLYTALVYQGPKVIDKILTELNSLVLTDGYKNISEAVGKSS